MRKLCIAALAVCLALIVGPSHAAVMVATADGDFDDYAPSYDWWTVSVVYDTSKAVLSVTSSGQTLHWDSAMGGPSPVLVLDGEIFGDLGASRRVGDATSFDVFLGAETYFFSIWGNDWGVEFGYGRYVPELLPVKPPSSFDVAYGCCRFFNQSAESTIFGFASDPGVELISYTQQLAIDRSSTPEPSSWAYLILGLCGLGMAIRQQKTGSVLGLA